jgi:hypothetical protein
MTQRVGFLLLGVVLTVAGCQQTGNQTNTGDGATQTPDAQNTPVTDPVARGQYLVTVMGCNDCHTPLKFGPNGPEPDMTRRLSGHPDNAQLPPPPRDPSSPWFLVSNMTAFAGPWGISYAINLTPDSLTGIGSWSEDTFTKALRTGRHMGVSRPILPPMPWQNVNTLTDEDMKAVYAYLRSVPPLRNQVPEAVIAGPPDTAAPTAH